MNSREKAQIGKQIQAGIDEVNAEQNRRLSGIDKGMKEMEEAHADAMGDIAAIRQVLIDKGIWPEVEAEEKPRKKKGKK